MSNLVPDGWNFKQLGDYVSDSAAGEWGNEAQGDQNDIPVLRSTNFTESGIIDYTKLAFRNIEEKKRIKKALKKGDILLEKSGGSPAQPVGRVVYFDHDTPHLFSNFTQKLVPVKDCDSKYLFYKLYFEYQNGTVLKFQQQTTGIINFQLAEYLGFKTIFAPLPEQQKIAAILSSVDDVIERTRAQIDKLKDLKTGMMQEFLTKGIGSGDVPHTEFKDSPVGRIPASWSVARLDELAKVGSSKRIRESEYVTEGVPFFRSKEVIRRSKWLDIEKTLYISKKRFTEISEKFGAPKQGDILITAVGTIGVVYLVEDREFYFKDGNLLWLRNIRSTVSSQYLAKIMASEGFQAEIDRVTGGSSQAALTIEKLQELTTVVPPLDEQEFIVGRLKSLDEKYQATYQKLLRLRDLKKALMQDLLTGKVRVNVDQKESAVA